MKRAWDFAKRFWPVLSIAAFLFLLYGIRLENRFAGALQREDEISTRNYQAKRANLAKGIAKLEGEAGRLRRRVFISDSLAALRADVKVSIPKKTQPGAAPVVTVSNAPRISDTTATVTINDTAYAVPVRVAEVVEQQRTELANADSLRMTADTVTRTVTETVKTVTETVAAADTAIAAAGKKPGWLRRALGKSLTVLCAAGGAGIGAAVGTLAGGGGAIPGAILGAGGGVAICEVAR